MYRINVSLNGQHVFFATVNTTLEAAKMIVFELRTVYMRRHCYEVTLSYVSEISEEIEV